MSKSKKNNLNIIEFDELEKMVNYKSRKSTQPVFVYCDKAHFVEKENPYIFLSLTDSWNDKIDRVKFLESDYLCFVRCFSKSKNESVAMWYMYAKNGIRIKYYKSDINSILKYKNKKFVIVTDSNEYEINENVIDNSEIIFNDVIYYNKNRYATYNSIKNKQIKESVLDKAIYLKRDCWQYENEIRLIIKIPKEYINFEKILGLKIYFSRKYKKTDIVKSPIIDDNLKIKVFGCEVSNSLLKGEIEFDIDYEKITKGDNNK